MTDSKIQYLIWETNNQRLRLILLHEYLEQKKNMSYEQWSAVHYIIDRTREYIQETDKEIRRLCGYGDDLNDN